MKLKHLSLLGFCCLTACHTPMTRDQQLQIYRTRCLEYGYQPGTIDFAHCMLEQEKLTEHKALEDEKLRTLQETNKLKKREVEIHEKAANSSKFKLNW